MEDNSYIQVGKITGSFGGDGFVKCKIFDGFMEELDLQDFVFIIHENIHVPYRIVEKNLKKSLIRFDDITTMRKAEVMRNQGIYILGDDMQTVESNENDSIIGFTIRDVELGEIGVIESVTNMTHQDLAYVKYQERIIMIPLHPFLIDKLDEEKKIIYMNLPEGIVDLDQ